MKAFLASLFLGITLTADIPPMPYRDLGACPFECCHYGAWTAVKPATARQTDDPRSSVAFQIKAGQKVTAQTGVVITRKPGTVRMQKEYSYDTYKVPAGTLLYTLHNGGEGTTLIWFGGKARWAELYAETVHKGTADYPWDVLSLPETEWWVKVRTENGAIGWILAPQDFQGMDSCGK
jgi:hypothetical protein